MYAAVTLAAGGAVVNTSMLTKTIDGECTAGGGR